MTRKISIPVNLEVKTKKKESSEDALAKVEIELKEDISVIKKKSSRLRQNPVKDAKNTQLSLNKKDFVLKFVKDKYSLIWPREMKIVNTLFRLFPNETFWNSLELKFKLNSLCWFLSDDGRKLLNTEYKKFIFEPQKSKEYSLEENNNIEFEIKKCETKPLSIREFLTLWQKKN